MNFDFSDEQYAVRDVAREVFDREWPAAALRDRWTTEEPGLGRVWKALAEVGVLGLTTPEEHGGAGGDLLDLALVLEEVGRAAVPDPIVDTVVVAATALAASGGEHAERWLPRIASGEAVAGVVLPSHPFVLDADVASFVLIERQGELHLVEGDQLMPVRIETEDRARRLFGIQSKSGSRLTDEPAVLDRARDHGATATACVLNGVSLRLLEMTLEHVKARRQFGRPIGSFQAVKHKLATMHVALDSARAASWYAAYAWARDLSDAGRAASVAKALASETTALVGGEALQLHGGIGFTWEHDLHLWLKRAMALEPEYGSAREHRARLAADLLRGGERT
ncbi:MAG TPA: acyl-CoA dehydrogenase family protein [Actinomycetota bacterium]|nr:acyl-CoA dehydrogenase family protein [Actinomycetota bacterium]